MKFRLLDKTEGCTYALVANPGDDAVSVVSDFARLQALSAAQITGVGAFERATVGWYDRKAQEYRRIDVDEQCEVLSLIGDVALSDGDPTVHVHAVLGLSDGTVRGGHLLEGCVWPTLEVILRETPATLRKRFRPEVGLALIDVDRSTDDD